ncbi:subtilisin-like protein [Lactarius quietus]|nr:subtilisin-like protein [Lactarius quietus]
MRYHMLSVLSIFTTTSLSVIATPFTPIFGAIHVKHSWSSVPDDWTNLGHPAADTTIDLHIALRAQDENALIEALHEVSSPDNPKYGKHLSKEQVAELVAPPTEVPELVSSWLKHHNVYPSMVLTKHGGSQVTLIGVPVSRANDLLGASYQLYHHTGTNTTVLRTLSYGLPEALLGCLQTVVPTTHFGFLDSPWQKPLKRRGGEAAAQVHTPARDRGTALSSRIASGAIYVTPALLRSLYRTSAYVPTAAHLNVIGIAGFNNEYPSPDDLMMFMRQYRADGLFASYTVALVNGGGYNPTNPEVEPNLDIQFSLGIAYPTRLIFYSTGNTPMDPLIAWLEYMLDQISVPQTISTSYGIPEYRVPPDYASYVCNLFAQLGARGASVLTASGDSGVGPENCVLKDANGNSHVQFFPTFPATCPWVTSVGAIKGHDPEKAARISGGGFSAQFPRPPYQDDAVPTFLQNLGSQYDGLYNANGRGIPDIALQSFGYDIVLKMQPVNVKGTSCSTPAAAAIISLLNDYMISSGRRTLGFLNPWLYGGGLSGLNDITIGSNPGCGTEGFSAIPGWDPVTGLGTLDFAKLGELLSYGF